MLSQYLIKKATTNGTIDTNAREYIGRMNAIVGILCNFLLSISKMLVGLFFSSVSILADGVNNLSDAGNSIICLISFKLANKPADRQHPFGHERYEYLASMLIGVSIILLAIEMFRNSIDKIINQATLSFSWLMVIVLIVSIFGKFALFLFYRNSANAIDSSSLHASAKDSLNDVIGTSAILVSTFILYFFNVNLDGYMGIMVAVLILKSGIEIIKEAADKILGEAPKHEWVANIEQTILKYKGVYGIHDLMVHNYGPNRCYASVHVEVDAREDILTSHDIVDNIERDFSQQNIQLVIHMDPIVLDNPIIIQLLNDIKECVHQLNPSLDIHDFRAVLGDTHSNLIFDCVVPFDCTCTFEEIQKHIDDRLALKEEQYYTVITFERPFS